MCDNQRTGADMLCGNLNMKLWDLKRTGNVKESNVFSWMLVERNNIFQACYLTRAVLQHLGRHSNPE